MGRNQAETQEVKKGMGYILFTTEKTFIALCGLGVLRGEKCL
jgi:hypothetical protein